MVKPIPEVKDVTGCAALAEGASIVV